MLAFYASRLETVEINNTFYRMPLDGVVSGWAEAVPPGFRFSVKVHRRLTHQRRMRFQGAQLDLFAMALRGLGHRLGPVLFQVPPTTEYVDGWLEQMLARVPPDWRIAFQFRHASWHIERVCALVEQAGAAICHADGEPVPGPFGRGGFDYIRLRRDRYPPRALRAWADRLLAQIGAGRDAYVYVKHEALGPAYALWLRDACRIAPEAAL
jgi:uncharacterized protein YecE (DUF72 family)